MEADSIIGAQKSDLAWTEKGLERDGEGERA